MKEVLVLGSFDNLKARHMRFLQEAARLGWVHVLLLSDRMVKRTAGQPARFPQAERRYFVEAIRYVDRVTLIDGADGPDALPEGYATGSVIWGVAESDDRAAKRAFCDARGVEYAVISSGDLLNFPPSVSAGSSALSPGRKKVIVTGCYDWFHSGHVRFFEEVSQLGDLYVVVGHDENIRLLKGDGHPMVSQDERRYMAGSIRYVTQALVSSGHGWLDAEPEIRRIQPDMYVVNEDGDRPEKRQYCAAHGIEYRVLQRRPKEGLPRRQSTDLRGF